MPYLVSVFMSRFFNDCIDTFYMHKCTHWSAYFCQVTRCLQKEQHLNNFLLVQYNNFHSAKKLNAAQTQTSPYLLKNSEQSYATKRYVRENTSSVCTSVLQ